MDDGSDLATKKVLRKLEPHVNKLITQENKGQSAARNIGIRSATGDYILPHDSDDFFEPTFCQKAINLLELNPGYKIVTCHVNILYPDSRKELFKPLGGDIKNFVKLSAAVGNSLFRKADWQLVEGYDELMRSGWEDWDFFIRIMSEGGKAFVIPEVLFNYRRLPETTTSVANRNKYNLWRYIYHKNEKIFKQHFDEFTDYLLERIEIEEKVKLNVFSSREYRIGQFLVLPFKKFKKLFRN